jgi:hypothetical protein
MENPGKFKKSLKNFEKGLDKWKMVWENGEIW